MPLTIAKNDFDTLSGGHESGTKTVVGTYSGVASYVTNGEVIAAAAFHADASTIHSFIISNSKDNSIQYVYDGTEVVAYNVSDEAEVTAATDLTATGKDAYFIAVLS